MDFFIRLRAIKWFLQAKINLIDLINILIPSFTYNLKLINVKSISKIFIDKIETFGSFNKCIFKNNIISPIYFPKEIKLLDFLSEAISQLDILNPHYYLIDNFIINNNDIIVDCGAADGIFSMLLINKCKKIYAIEPLPIFINSLKKSFENFNNIEILPYALGKEKKESQIVIPENIFGSKIEENNNNTKLIKINMDTIDNLFFNKNIDITFLKADLEGFEIEMLEGAKKTISKNKPKISITTYHNAEHCEQIKKILKSYVPEYNFLTKGKIKVNGKKVPVMLHAWIN